MSKEYRLSLMTDEGVYTMFYIKSYDNDIPQHFPANDETGEPETVEIGNLVLTFEDGVDVEEWPIKI